MRRLLLLLALALSLAVVSAAGAASSRISGDLLVEVGSYEGTPVVVFEITSLSASNNPDGDTVTIDVVCDNGYSGTRFTAPATLETPFSFGTLIPAGDCVAYLRYNRAQGSKVFSTVLDSEIFSVG